MHKRRKKPLADKLNKSGHDPASPAQQPKRRSGARRLIAAAIILPAVCLGGFAVISAQGRQQKDVTIPGPGSVLLGHISGDPIYGNPREIQKPPPMDLDPKKNLGDGGIAYQKGQRIFKVRLRDLLDQSPAELEKMEDWDLVVLSFLAADGLPGSRRDEDVNICVSAFEDIARKIQNWTERDMELFRKNPAEYGNSEAQFKMRALITYLRRDFDIRYDPDWAAPPERMRDIEEAIFELTGDTFWKDPMRLFVQGILKGHGTCASLPVLTVHLGRSLGYPLKLVGTRDHLFARWVGSNEVFNIECTGEGYISHSDAYYRKWPHPVSDAEIRKLGYLRSKTRAQELAILLHNRALCLIHNKRIEESYAWTVKAMQFDGLSDLVPQFIKKSEEQREDKAKLALIGKMIADKRINLMALHKKTMDRLAQQRIILAGTRDSIVPPGPLIFQNKTTLADKYRMLAESYDAPARKTGPEIPVNLIETRGAKQESITP